MGGGGGGGGGGGWWWGGGMGGKWINILGGNRGKYLLILWS